MPPVRYKVGGGAVHALQSIPDGDAGIRATLEHMRVIVREWRTHPLIVNLAVGLVSNCRGKDWLCEAKVLHAYVRDRIRYVRDVVDVETIRTPELTLRLAAGDCDDKAILLASLLQAIGHPVQFFAAAFGADAPFSHVFVRTRIGDGWTAAETTEPWSLGRFPPGIVRYMILGV